MNDWLYRSLLCSLYIAIDMIQTIALPSSLMDDIHREVRYLILKLILIPQNIEFSFVQLIDQGPFYFKICKRYAHTHCLGFQ